MTFTNGYEKLLCESQPPRLIPEQEDGPELQGGLGGDTGSPFGEPELPEHLQDDEAEPGTSYIQQLERKVEEIKGDIEDPNVSAASIANALVGLVRENTNWNNEKEATKGKTALIQILGNMGLKHMTASPDMQIPEQEDWEGYDQWNLKTKRGLHYFAYNQYLVAQGLGVTKLQNPGSHTTPYYESVMRENQEKLAVKLLQKADDVNDAERILQKLGQWGPELNDIVRRLWVEKGWGDDLDAPGTNAGRDAPGQFIYDNVNRSGGVIAEGFDEVKGFLKQAMELYFLPVTFPIEWVIKTIRGDADSREQAAAQDAISQANSENPDLGKVDLWQQIESRVEALEGGQGEPDPWPEREYASPEPEQDPLQPHVTYAGANVGVEESTIPSLAVLEVLAKCDTHTFCNILESIGLRILGTHKFDPLDVRVEEQTIASLASNMTEAIDDDIDLDPELAAIKNLAESFGYIVEVRETSVNRLSKRHQAHLAALGFSPEQIKSLDPDDVTDEDHADEKDYPATERLRRLEVRESRVDTSGGPSTTFGKKAFKLNPDNPKAPPLNLAHIDGNSIHSLLQSAQRGEKWGQHVLKQAGYEWEDVPNINARYASTRE